MKVLFDVRVLTHKHYTGVENYLKTTLDQLIKNQEVCLTESLENSISNMFLQIIKHRV